MDLDLHHGDGKFYALPIHVEIDIMIFDDKDVTK